MPSYYNSFNVFECGRKILYLLDVSYERACTDTATEEYFTDILDSLIDDNERHSTPLSSKNLQDTFSRVMEEEEKYSERNVNNINMDTLFQSPVTINTQRKDANVKNERRIAADIHAEMMK